MSILDNIQAAYAANEPLPILQNAEFTELVSDLDPVRDQFSNDQIIAIICFCNYLGQGFGVWGALTYPDPNPFVDLMAQYGY